MNVKLKTWREVCQLAKIELGDTPKDTSVVRLISRIHPMIFRLKGLDKDAPPPKKLML